MFVCAEMELRQQPVPSQVFGGLADEAQQDDD